jgi:DNA-directed RNA polymerase specialized sigma24 family protein
MNRDIEIALKDKELEGIMNKAASGFNKQLSEDELYTCKINALWKSLKNWDEDKNSKFTTYLYNGVKFECIREVKFKKKDYGRGGKELEYVFSSGNYHVGEVDMLDEIEALPDAEIMLDRAKNYTIKEISDIHNINRETIRRKIENSSKVLASRLK